MKPNKASFIHEKPATKILGAILLCGLVKLAGYIGPLSLSAQQEIPCSGDLSGLAPGIDYEAGLVILFIREDHKEISETIFKASQKRAVITEVASFDSVGVRFGLEGLFSAQEYSPFYRRKFYLRFPSDTDVGLITSAYCDLPYVELAAINGFAHLDTAIDWGSWAEAKWASLLGEGSSYGNDF